MFQSLFWWKSEIKFVEYPFVSGIYPEFQSLFWWKSEIKFKATLLLDAVKDSFNPCFGGNQKSNSQEAPQQFGAGSFQSLFWWKSEIKFTKKCGEVELLHTFQSLFWWKSEIKFLESTKSFPDTSRFQSLFWWKSEIKSCFPSPANYPPIVSILVLVEIRNQIWKAEYSTR